MTTFGGGRLELRRGDCLEIMGGLAANSVDSVVTDPPYHLTSIVRRFGASNAAPARYGSDGLYTRVSRGFMGKEWDGGDIAFRAETWEKVYRVLKPGGYLVAFSAPKCQHRMVCAIEDVGFEIRDGLMWLFGTGVPKSHAIDGFEGWGTALKPAYEPICLARKPLDGTNFANMMAWGVGALNIDGCRVEGEPSPSAAMRASRVAPSSRKPGEYGDSHAIQNRVSPERWMEARPGEKLGRWPANIVHDGSDEVVAIFPAAPGQLADVSPNAPSPKTSNVYGAMKREGEASQNKRYVEKGSTNFAALPGARRGDTGSAARFFYSAKATKHDRAGSKHPTVKPVSLMRWLCRMVTPPGGLVLDPFAGSGTTGAAAHLEGFRAVLCEREEEYQADIANRLRELCGEDGGCDLFGEPTPGEDWLEMLL